MTEQEMRREVRVRIVKKYGRIKTFAYAHDIYPPNVSSWISGRLKMPDYVLDMFGLERIVTVEYKEKEQVNE